MKSEVCVLNRPFSKFLFFAFILFMGISQASGQDVELGIEYVKAGEYEKAKSIFQKLAKNKDIAGSIHKPYLQTLYKLKEVDEAEKF
jgi:pentatricopeptide repeat protein